MCYSYIENTQIAYSYIIVKGTISSMSDEQQPQHLVVETEEKKDDTNELAKSDFIVFMANPDHTSIREFAESREIPYSTVVSWQGQEWFRDGLIKECKKQLLPHLPSVYKALRNIGEQGSVPALQLFLRQLTVLEPDKVEQKHKIEFPKPILGGKSDVYEDDSIGQDTATSQEN